MFGISLNSSIVRLCARLLGRLPGIQADSRERLVKELQGICSKCDDAYSHLIKRLLRVKGAYRDPPKLVKELRQFAADGKTRAAFKPEHLCGEIDHLLQELASNLNALGYSIRWANLEALKDMLGKMGEYDGELYQQYDNFRAELDQLATQIEQTEAADQKQWTRYVKQLVSDTEAELKRSITAMRQAKSEIMKIAF